MSGAAVQAITFDLWDTVLVDDSDEPKRAAQGLASKPIERRKLVRQFLERHEPIPAERIDVAYDTVDAAFRQVWYAQNVTWTVRQRLEVLLKGLGRNLPEPEMADLVRLHEDMELTVRPDLAAGAAEVLQDLHGKYRLGVISDAIFSPGRALRQLLAGYDIMKYFDAFIFSDEIGRAKPDARVFEAAAGGLGVRPCDIVHIGDREPKDVAGPHAVGARAVLCTVVKDRGSQRTKADAICSVFSDLPDILKKLDRQ